MSVITIDTGTTNTRVKVWKQDKVVATSFEEVGVRDTAITGSKEKLQNGVKTAIQKALDMAGINEEDVSLFLVL